MKKHVVILICLSILVPAAICFAEEEKLFQVRAVLYIKSNVSEGAHAPERLVEMADRAGIDAVFLTEYHRPRWEYGLFPLRNLIKKTVEKPGLLRYGLRRCRKKLAEIKKNTPGVTIFLASRIVPAYYWTGHPFHEDGLTLHDWDIQFIVSGIDISDYWGIPTVSNRGFASYGLRSILKLWPVALLIIGIVLLKKKHSRFYIADPICWLLIITGALFTMNNFPFKHAKYHQYNEEMGVGPYQEVIDYVNRKGGVVFWSNPEVSTSRDVGPVRVASSNAIKHMLDSEDYTGFCCFYEGYRDVGGPGGVWDTVLEEYCSGKRKNPAWAIGEMTYHAGEGPGSKRIDEVQTVFLVPSNTREDILEAMRLGRMYAVRCSEGCRLRLDSFIVKAPCGAEAIMGEELEAAGPVTVSFGVSWEGKAGRAVTAQLIRSGEVVKEFSIKEPGEFVYTDDLYEDGRKTYYRLDVRGGYPDMLFSNPVFVDFK